jgi:hypothetical protein
MKEHCAVTFRPIRFTNSEGTEIRYSGCVKLCHPPFTGKILLKLDLEIAQSSTKLLDNYRSNRRSRGIHVVDMTDNVKMESTFEHKEQKRNDLPYRNSRQPFFSDSCSVPPLESGVHMYQFLHVLSCLCTNIIFL